MCVSQACLTRPPCCCHRAIGMACCFAADYMEVQKV